MLNQINEITLPSTVYQGFAFFDVSEDAGAAVPIAAASTTLKSGVTVKALSTNAAVIFVGSSTVTATAAGATNATGGIELSAKESVFLEIDDLSKIYIRGAADGYITYIAS